MCLVAERTGANPWSPGQKLTTAMHYVATSGHVDMVKVRSETNTERSEPNTERSIRQRAHVPVV